MVAGACWENTDLSILLGNLFVFVPCPARFRSEDRNL